VFWPAPDDRQWRVVERECIPPNERHVWPIDLRSVGKSGKNYKSW
jgi:hypothetical protein